MNRIKFSQLAHFTPVQKQALKYSKKHRYLLYGGQLGGGKSYFLRWTCLYWLLYIAGKYKLRNVRAGLFCEDYPALNDRQISKVQYEFPSWIGTMNKAAHEFNLNSKFGGGVLCFRNLDDPSRYQSSEFAIIAIDELTKNSKSVFDFLRTRLRWTLGEEGKFIKETKFLSGTNPGGKGHHWVKKLWLDRKFEETEKESKEFKFIPARATDNPHLPQSYIDSLQGLPEKMRRALAEGDWNVFEGQFFSEWSEKVHICQPFKIPKHWLKFRAIDFGRTDPFCCLWFALSEKGNIYCYREYYQKGRDADENARQVIFLTPKNERIEWTVADSSIFAKTGHGKTIAEIFMDNNLMCFPSEKKRIPGWILMHQYLRWNELEKPKLIFFENCINSIRTIPELSHAFDPEDDKSKGDPEDLDTTAEDHCADVVRYFLQALRKHKSKKTLNPTEERFFLEKKSRNFVDNLNNFYE